MTEVCLQCLQLILSVFEKEVSDLFINNWTLLLCFFVGCDMNNGVQNLY